jgi:CubicO group peptidase (beta-lactamase class C family)
MPTKAEKMYLDGGRLDGRQVIPPAWVQASASPYVPELSNRLYGLWWRERPWRNYPHDDSYFAWGYGGQFLFLFPSWDLIVVTTARWDVVPLSEGPQAFAILDFVDDRILPLVTP